MPHLFVSYSREDRADLDRLSELLSQRGFEVWDDSKVLPGHSFRQAIRTAIEQSAATFVIWSAASARSPFVLNEVDTATKLEKPVIPLRKPGFDPTSLPLGHGETQTCLISERDAIFAALKALGIEPKPTEISQTDSEPLTAQQVFRSAIPDVTLIDRTRSTEGRSVAESLDAYGHCIRLCGPTRSGKTVLLDQLMRTRKALYVSGGVINDLDNLLEYLGLQLEPPLVGATQAQLVTALLDAGRPIVIDDYHRIHQPTRHALVRRLQAFLDANILVVLVSWTDIDGRLIDADPGVGGRSEPVFMSLWNEVDIQQIGKLGFSDGLNATLHPQTLAAIARQAFRNPSLMQQYCYAVADRCGVLKRQETNRTVSLPPASLEDLFKASCKRTRANFEGWIERRGDQMFDLSTGKRTSVFGLICLAIARMEPIHAMGSAKLARRMKEFVVDPSWITAPLAANATHDFMKRLEKNPHRHTAIDFADDKIHIHPFFKRYLLWDFLPSKGYPTPDLTGYSDDV